MLGCGGARVTARHTQALRPAVAARKVVRASRPTLGRSGGTGTSRTSPRQPSHRDPCRTGMRWARRTPTFSEAVPPPDQCASVVALRPLRFSVSVRLSFSLCDCAGQEAAGRHVGAHGLAVQQLPRADRPDAPLAFRGGAVAGRSPGARHRDRAGAARRCRVPVRALLTVWRNRWCVTGGPPSSPCAGVH